MKLSVDPAIQAAALKAPSLDRVRLACMVLTLSSALFVGLPIFLAGVAPRPLPPIEAETASLDPILGLCFLVELAALGAALLVQRFWPRPAQAWQADSLAAALGRTWLIRYALGEAICVAGALGLFLGYQQGLLPVSSRLWLLAGLPMLALLWMLRHWPDEAMLRKAFFNS